MRQPHHERSQRRSRKCLLILATAASIFIRLTTAQADGVQLQVDQSESRFAGWHFNTGLNEASGAPAGFPDFVATDELSQANVNLAPAPNDIRLSGYQSQTIASPPGSTVTVNLQNFALSGHSTLTLLGDATSTFIINVTNQFSLTQSAKVLLSGGLQWNHVFFNILGAGPVISLGGKSILVGTLTASQRKLVLNGHAHLYGLVSAQRTVIRQAAQIVTPPIVSP